MYHTIVCQCLYVQLRDFVWFFLDSIYFTVTCLYMSNCCICAGGIDINGFVIRFQSFYVDIWFFKSLHK